MAVKHLGNAGVFRSLRTEFLNLLRTLRRAKVAHGDLQHRNILVTARGTMRLVDYDGMYVPGIELECGRLCPEGGHPNFQHPRRKSTDYAHELDSFSSIVIYLSLLAVEHHPHLWKQFYNADNLLFVRQDFEGPWSPIVRELHNSGRREVRELVAQLMDECRRSSALAVRDLECVLSGDEKPSLKGVASPGSPGTGAWADDYATRSSTVSRQQHPASGAASIPSLRVSEADGSPVVQLRKPSVRSNGRYQGRAELVVHNDGMSPRNIEIYIGVPWLRSMDGPTITIRSKQSRAFTLEADFGAADIPQASVRLQSPPWFEDDTAYERTIHLEFERPAHSPRQPLREGNQSAESWLTRFGFEEGFVGGIQVFFAALCGVCGLIYLVGTSKNSSVRGVSVIDTDNWLSRLTFSAI